MAISFTYEDIEKVLKNIPKESLKKIINEVYSNNDREGVFLAALDEADIDLMERLLEAGFNLNAPIENFNDQSYLNRAVRNQQLEVVNFLINNKIKFKDPIDPGYNAILYAVQLADMEITKTLIEHGADVNMTAKNYDGDSFDILRLIQEQKRKDVFEYLLTVIDRFSPENKTRLEKMRIRMLF